MRFGAGLVGLLVVLAIVVLAARKQLGSTRVVLPPAVQQAPAGSGQPASVREQSRQTQQQIQQQVQSLMQQPRPVPGDEQ